MVSAAEQLAANLNFSALAKAEELKKRIWFTIGALLVYRLGTYIPLPGIDPGQWEQIFRTQAGGILGMFNLFAGGGINRMAIFALNIMPYISASIIIQLMTTVSPTLENLKKEGEQGRKVINQYTRYLTVLLAAFQAYGIALGLEGAGSVVTSPGWFFRISTVITLTGGTVFLMWLGEQVTSRGIGNGISLIIFAGIVAELPSAIAGMLELGRQGALSTGLILVIIVMAIVVIAFIVFMERAQRRLLIQYPKRQVGNRMFEGQSSHLPLKLNTSGVIPPIFASSLLLLPTTVANFNAGQGPEWLTTITTQLGHGRPLFLDPLRRAHRLLCLLLHRDRVQPDRDGRQPQEAWRLHSRDPPWRAYGRIHRLRAHANHGGRRSLSRRCVPHPRDSHLLRRGPVLFRRHLAFDRGERYDGYSRADSGLPAGAPV